MPWRGEIAFADEALAFRGESAENRFHAHAAVQCVHSPTGVRVRDQFGNCFEGRSWLVRSGVGHRLEPAPALSLILIEPQSRLAAGVLRQVPDQPIAELNIEFGLLFDAPHPLASALQALKQQVVGPQAVDRRVLAALDHLDGVFARDPAASAAAHAGISSTRLRALCRAQLGVPFAKLVLWRKVRRACLSMSIGESLSQAALDAGFADQAHLTRTMAEVIGLTPGIAAHAGT